MMKTAILWLLTAAAVCHAEGLATMTNCVCIKDRTYFSVIDSSDASIRAASAPSLDGYVFAADEMLSYILENRSKNDVSLLETRSYEPFIARLYDHSGNLVPFTAQGKAWSVEPPSQRFNPKASTLYRLGPDVRDLFRVADFFKITNSGTYILEVKMRTLAFVQKRWEWVISPPVRVAVVVATNLSGVPSRPAVPPVRSVPYRPQAVAALSNPPSILTPGVDPATATTRYSDYWGPSPIREVKTSDHVTLVGTTLGLDAAGTNVEVRLMVAIINRGTADFPRDVTDEISAQARSSPDESSLANLLGQFHGKVSLDPSDPQATSMTAEKQWGGMLDEIRALFVYEIAFKIPLNRKPDSVPNYISLLSSMCGELDEWNYTKHWNPGPPPATPLPPEVPTVKIKGARPDKAPSRQEPAQTSQPVAQQARGSLPALKIAVSKEKDFMIITCTPVADNGLLEQTDLSFSPLEWRPIRSRPDQAGRWFVPADDGSRVFRVRIPK